MGLFRHTRGCWTICAGTRTRVERVHVLGGERRRRRTRRRPWAPPDGRRRVLGRARAFHRVSQTRARSHPERLRASARRTVVARRPWCSRASFEASPLVRRAITRVRAQARIKWRRCATRVRRRSRRRDDHRARRSISVHRPREQGAAQSSVRDGLAATVSSGDRRSFRRTSRATARAPRPARSLCVMITKVDAWRALPPSSRPPPPRAR